ncbi:MAG TPA: tripartite tricarboxylate transporter substrate-binding protein, partial [Xanthobacteraceae bacterium]|nr:tripartite tricarboxylate transporter substrate-binding protein [Xanthobacteraceae bacterium]
ARYLGQKLSERLHKTVIIENRPGTGTVLGAVAVASAPPDGHTLLMATSTTLAINVSLYRKLPYEPVKDLVPVALVVNVPFVLVVNPALGLRTLPELIKFAKANPAKLTYGSGGIGSPHHLYAELLKSMTRIELTHIPYQGSVPALNEVVAGRTDLMFSDLAPALPLIREGKLVALGVSSATTVPAVPGIPPLASAGAPGYEAVAWQMIVAPAGMSKDLIARLNGEFREIMSAGDVQQYLASIGMAPIVGPGPEELERFLQSEIARWAKVVEQSGATAD